MKAYTLPVTLTTEIKKLETLIEQYQKGIITTNELKAFRVPSGVYEQRTSGSFMIRIRCTAGIITPAQLMTVASLSSRFGADSLHLTTRQELQIHSVSIEDVISILRELQSCGLSTRGGGGNTVRNIIAHHTAGIDPDEVFDVTPHATALTTLLIAEPDSWTLPRKYKIAFSGSDHDKGYATLNDLGFIAKIENSVRGFSVYVAGGMGVKSSPARKLFNFVPENEVYRIARALKSLFSKYGNRKNKHAARIRFLYETLGRDEFEKKFLEEFNAQTDEVLTLFSLDIQNEQPVPVTLQPEQPENSDDFELWKSRYITEQKQVGLYSVIIPVELGDIPNKTAEELGCYLQQFGEDVIRLTRNQNFCLRNIPRKQISNIYNFLKQLLSDYNRPLICDSIIACTGAATCKLGICLSQGLAQRVITTLQQADIDIESLSGSKINISGCPNSCGQHPAATIGFFGKAARDKEYLYPAYNVVIDAQINSNSTSLAHKVGEIAARDIPDFLLVLINEFHHHRADSESFAEFIHHQGDKIVPGLLACLAGVPSFYDDKNYYFDWGASEIFSLANRGIGECSAGLFDLIDTDFKIIDETITAFKSTGDNTNRSELLEKILFHTCRSLLITRGVEVISVKETCHAFIKCFIDTGIVDAAFKPLIEKCTDTSIIDLTTYSDQILNLAGVLQALYNSMDNSLQFPIPADSKATTDETITEQENEQQSILEKDSVHLIKDFRGVACPMNFVKTKLELSKIKKHDILEIYLDDGEPINNVPGSVQSEGHRIISQTKIEEYWSVVIEKQ